MLKKLLKLTTKDILNKPDSNGLTPIHHAAKYLNIVALQLLRKHGANIHSKTPDKYTAKSLSHKSLNTRLLWPCSKNKKDTQKSINYIFSKKQFKLLNKKKTYNLYY